MSRIVLTAVLATAALQPLAAQALLGTWDGTTYVAPGRSFAFTPPTLHGETAAIRVSDAEPDARSHLVQVADDLCRSMVVVETRGELGQGSLEAWVSREVVQGLDPQRADSLERRVITTRFGNTIELRWVARGGAPCAEVHVTATGQRSRRTQPDADVRMLVFHLPGRFVRVVYLLGRSAQGPVVEGVRRGPIDEMLPAVLDGFEPVS